MSSPRATATVRTWILMTFSSLMQNFGRCGGGRSCWTICCVFPQIRKMKRNGGRPRDCRLKKIASISNCSNGRDKPVHELYDLRDRNTADNEHRARQDRNDDLSDCLEEDEPRRLVFSKSTPPSLSPVPSAPTRTHTQCSFTVSHLQRNFARTL